MSPKVKLAVYAVLLILAAWFGARFHSNYSTVTQAAAQAGVSDIDFVAPKPVPAPTNLDASNLAPANVVTDVVAQATNPPPPSTNARVKIVVKKAAPLPDLSATRGAMMRDFAVLVVALAGLGLLITLDVTHYLGGRAADYLFIDVGDAMRDPEYERAEEKWVNGNFLEAVQLLRDYLKKHPRELHAALRIGEIYEKDLHNPLAAALEYEEVLRHKLPAERWAWTAIHLCNLYTKLDQQKKAEALLRRVARDYPKTAAAKKARAHLGLPEPEEEDNEAAEGPQAASPSIDPRPAAPKPGVEPPAPEPPKSSLPPGFRPKE